MLSACSGIYAWLCRCLSIGENVETWIKERATCRRSVAGEKSVKVCLLVFLQMLFQGPMPCCMPVEIVRSSVGVASYVCCTCIYATYIRVYTSYVELAGRLERHTHGATLYVQDQIARIRHWMPSLGQRSAGTRQQYRAGYIARETTGRPERLIGFVSVNAESPQSVLTWHQFGPADLCAGGGSVSVEVLSECMSAQLGTATACDQY